MVTVAVTANFNGIIKLNVYKFDDIDKENRALRGLFFFFLDIVQVVSNYS